MNFPEDATARTEWTPEFTAYLAGLTFHQPDENGICRGWKLVARDGSSRGGQFHWPLVSAKAGQPAVAVRASNPDPVNTGPCPQREGDGLCLARTIPGAQSGGLALGQSIVLLISYSAVDVLGGDEDKIRVGACRVVDVADPNHLIQVGLAADLYGADLRGANLEGADLRRADLREADLRRADLREANLYGADLREANLYGADLREANLEGADLPEGFVPPGGAVR